ncbi:MAG: GvpL/GvpF family gas vesicle protein [Prochlorothrix sp.]|nr:GvpL/GvpF family gas vesicle protein [Prochlorothrix sp.]
MYTFAFLPEPETPLTLPDGIQGSLHWIGDGVLGAVVEPNLDMEALQADDQALMGAVLTHDRVIQDLFQQSVLLPLQFGTSFNHREGLLNHLAQQRSIYQERLTLLSGKVEYTLRLQPKPLESDPAPVPDSTQAPLKGRAYFLAKKQQYQSLGDRQAEQQNQLKTLLATLNRSYPDLRQGEAQEGQERIYLLVGQRRTSHLQKQVQQWQDSTPLWELRLSEPLPPYHFVR